MYQDYDNLFKIVKVGDLGTGKTSIMLRYCENIFPESNNETTGIDFKLATVDVEGKAIKLQIWDTAGQERFQTICGAYYRGADAVLVVYSCEDAQSFSNTARWFGEINIHGSPHVKRILVANKIDSENRIVSTEEGFKLAQQYNVPFIEVSAKNGQGIDDLFQKIARLLIGNDLHEEVSRPSEESKIE